MPDCNQNGAPDECDIAASGHCPDGLCTANCAGDCNDNCVPDECEPNCNDNGWPDECDITAGTSQDIDQNGIPDECLPPPPPTGACCFTGVACAEEWTEDYCEELLDGTYLGDASTCSPAACPVCGDDVVEPGPEDCDGPDDADCPGLCRADCTCTPQGACCDPAGGTCTVEIEADCGAGYIYVGDDTDCTPNPCPACGNSRLEAPEECDGSLDYRCPGRCLGDCTCAPEPSGGCCLSDESCQEITESVCIGYAGTYKGDATVCLGDNDGDGSDNLCQSPQCPYIHADRPRPECMACLPLGCPGCNEQTSETCQDGRVSMNEMSSEITAWKRGCHDEGAGTALAMLLWWTGETYCWDIAEQNWSFTSPAPPSGCCARGRSGLDVGDSAGFAAGMTDSGGATAQILFRGPDGDDSTWQVKTFITINAPEAASTLLLEYEIPKGWEVGAVSDGGEWDEIHRKVKWGGFFEDLSRTVSFTAGRLESTAILETSRVRAEPGIGDFSGTVWFDGVGQPITTEP